jgi:hypothetical protein
MANDSIKTQPKPFVFVLMPFDAKFEDIYKFGIKGAAAEAGAYAERLDEQVFSEGMLDRIFNQISKADVVVADMSERNPNVFYEVGYAHALGKIVLLITSNAKDIPFDLKHRQHTVYGNKIDYLRKELVPKLIWAIAESKNRQGMTSLERISVRLFLTDLVANCPEEKLPTISGKLSVRNFPISISVRNDSPDAVLSLSHVYLFTREGAALLPAPPKSTWTGFIATTPVMYPATMNVPPAIQTETNSYEAIDARENDSLDGLTVQYRLPIAFNNFPPGSVEQRDINFELKDSVQESNEIMRLRLHGDHQYWEYRFRMKISFEANGKPE